MAGKFTVIENERTPSRIPAYIGLFSGLALLCGFVLYFFSNSLFKFIAIHEIGVKKIEFGPTSGLVKTDFGPGYHFGPAFYCTWYSLPATVQSIDMLKTNTQSSEKSLFSRSGKEKAVVTAANNDIKIKTIEGYDVSVDISIKYRIKNGMGHRVIENFASPDLRFNILSQTAKTVCNEILGQLSTEDFYNSDKRLEKSIELKTRLFNEYDNRGFELLDILIRGFQFDTNYEVKIMEKTLADQDAELNKSRSRAAEFEGETNKVRAETEAQVKETLERGEKTLRVMKAENDLTIRKIAAEAEKLANQIRSDANLYLETQTAKAQLLLKSAEAEVTQLQAEALTGDGATHYVALEMVKNLNLGEFKVSSQHFNPLEVGKVLENFLPPATTRDPSPRNR